MNVRQVPGDAFGTDGMSGDLPIEQGQIRLRDDADIRHVIDNDVLKV